MTGSAPIISKERAFVALKPLSPPQTHAESRLIALRNVPIVAGPLVRTALHIASRGPQNVDVVVMRSANDDGAHQCQHFPPRKRRPGIHRVEAHPLVNHASRPKRLISAPTNASPAFATRFWSPKVTLSRSILRDTRATESAYRVWVPDDIGHHHLRIPGSTYRGRAHLTPPRCSVNRG